MFLSRWLDGVRERLQSRPRRRDAARRRPKATFRCCLEALEDRSVPSTFNSPVILDSNGSPTSMVAADFNGDGNQDLAIGHTTGPTVDVFLGNGNGTFALPTAYTVAAGQASL